MIFRLNDGEVARERGDFINPRIGKILDFSIELKGSGHIDDISKKAYGMKEYVQ